MLDIEMCWKTASSWIDCENKHIPTHFARYGIKFVRVCMSAKPAN